MIGERNKTPNPDNSGSHRSQGPAKIEVWKRYSRDYSISKCTNSSDFGGAALHKSRTGEDGDGGGGEGGPV